VDEKTLSLSPLSILYRSGLRDIFMNTHTHTRARARARRSFCLESI